MTYQVRVDDENVCEGLNTIIDAYREIGKLPLIIRNPTRCIEDHTDSLKEILSPLKVVDDFLKFYRGPLSDVVILIESRGKQFLYTLENFLSRDYVITDNHIDVFGETFLITEMTLLFIIVYVPSWD